MEIDQAPDPYYDSVKINYVGFVDPYALEGMVVLKYLITPYRLVIYL